MRKASENTVTGFYTSGGSLPRQVAAQRRPDGSVLIDGQPARSGEQFFATEGEAVVAALRANVEEERRLRDVLNARGDDAELRGRLVAVNERIITLQRRGAELEQLAQAEQDHDEQAQGAASHAPGL